MNAIDILILDSFSAAFDLKYVIRHYKKLLLCIPISGIHCNNISFKEMLVEFPNQNLRQISPLKF